MIDKLREFISLFKDFTLATLLILLTLFTCISIYILIVGLVVFPWALIAYILYTLLKTFLI